MCRPVACLSLLLVALFLLTGCRPARKPSDPPNNPQVDFDAITDEADRAAAKKIDQLGGTLEIEGGKVVMVDFTPSEGADPISNDALDAVAELESIRKLYLTRTDVTDDGLAKLAPLKNLETLNLDGTRISDAALEFVKVLPQLKLLTCRGTKVTDAAGLQLKAEMKEQGRTLLITQ